MRNTFVRYLLSIIVICIAAVSTQGCKKVLKTIVIKPDSSRFYYPYRGMDENDHTCVVGSCFHTHGTSCDPGLTADDSTIVGYSHRYEPGTQPCPCWWYVDCAYRGYVGFNVSELKKTGIVSAKLKWSPSTQRSVGDSATNTGSCIAKMYRATEPWKTDQGTAGEQMSWSFSGESNPAPTEKDVSIIVRGWLNDTMPNYGFFFVGPNENVHEKNNNACLTTLNDLRLEAVISVDP